MCGSLGSLKMCCAASEFQTIRTCEPQRALFSKSSSNAGQAMAQFKHLSQLSFIDFVNNQDRNQNMRTLRGLVMFSDCSFIILPSDSVCTNGQSCVPVHTYFVNKSTR